MLVAAILSAGAEAHPNDGPARTVSDPRAALEKQLAAETDTLAKTIATVDDKLHAADLVRAQRVRAAIPDSCTRPAPTPHPASARPRPAAERPRGCWSSATRSSAACSPTRRLAAAAPPSSVITVAAERVPTVALPTSVQVPAKGTIARHFGEYQHERSGATLSRRGVDLEVEGHAPAVAPADGIVRYAGPIRGLDHGVILDHGDYLTVVAKLGDLTLPIGTRVARGDRLGRAAHHRVYFEVRVKVGPGGLPIDPEPLFQR